METAQRQGLAYEASVAALKREGENLVREKKRRRAAVARVLMLPNDPDTDTHLKVED